MIDLFNVTHHTFTSGHGAVSINLVHLPYPGTVLDQPGKLMEMFDIVKTEMYEQYKLSAKRPGK